MSLFLIPVGSGTISGPKEAVTKSDGTFSPTCSGNGCSMVWGEPKVFAHYAGDRHHNPATSNEFDPNCLPPGIKKIHYVKESSLILLIMEDGVFYRE